VRMRGMLGSLLAVLGTLIAAPAALGATLSVDDDRQECTAAAFTSVQEAIDAATPGDTVAICPGHYAEGTGDANTNAITVDKSLTLKGAGADLVTISPRRYDGNDGVIAEDARDPDDPSIPAQSIRHPRGNILTVVGTPAFAISVDVSGISFDGNGVAVKAGVVFLDAQGSLVRSRVTDVVTSEMPGAWDQPGGYRAEHYLGYGVAHVSAAQSAPAGLPRTLRLDNVRVDEYNRVGVLIDGGRNAGSPVDPSGVDMRGAIVGSQIVGRSLCPDAHVDGDCGRYDPPSNPDPKPLTDGPLMGQDGVRIAADARATITGSIVTQNLVQGEGSPVRGEATSNQNLRRAAGIRLVGADAANSSVTRTNVVDNAYGILNAGPDDSSEPASRLPAEHNWWGLRSPRGGNQPQPVNTGPAISPVINPPYPENPVNGAPVADEGGVTSTAVDFFPYRNGPQSEPNSGQWPILTAPMPVDDSGPAVSVRPERPRYRRGETVKLIAEASDDFGVRRVTFFDGANEAGSDTSPPYEAAFTIPENAPCGAREVAATAEDSLGQTETGTATLEVVCDATAGGGGTGGAGPVLEGPVVELPENLRRVRRVGETVTARASAPNGVRHVDFLLGARRVCRDAQAPYRCRMKPLSTEIGSQTVRAIVTDRMGLTGQDLRQVVVPRFKPRALLVDVRRTQLRGIRVLKTLVARVVPTRGVRRARACANGRVTAVVRVGLITLADKQVKLDRNCRAVIWRFSGRHNESRRFKYKVRARFGGTTVMVPARKTRRFS
jgi:hypothetical protein